LNHALKTINGKVIRHEVKKITHAHKETVSGAEKVRREGMILNHA
jgi:hypothetical protein